MSAFDRPSANSFQEHSSSRLNMCATRDARRPRRSSAILIRVECRIMPRRSSAANSAGTRRTECQVDPRRVRKSVMAAQPVGRNVRHFSPQMHRQTLGFSGNCLSGKGKFPDDVERAKGFEPSTPTLARCPMGLRQAIRQPARASIYTIIQSPNRIHARRLYPGPTPQLALKCLECAP